MTIKIRRFPSRPEAMIAGPTIPYATLKMGFICEGIVFAEESGKNRVLFGLPGPALKSSAEWSSDSISSVRSLAAIGAA